MHRVLIALVLAGTLLTGCARAGDLAADARARVDDASGRIDELTDRAEEVRDRFTWCGAAVRLGTAVVERDAEAASVAAAELRASAPAELVDELETIVAAVVAAQTGDTMALLDDDVEAAARSVLETAVESCGVTGT